MSNRRKSATPRAAARAASHAAPQAASGPDAAFRLAAFLPYRLAALAEDVSQALAQVYAVSFDLTRYEWRVVATLAETADLPSREIARRAQLDKMQVSRAVQRLEARGLVRGATDPADRRSRTLQLTRSGRTLYERIVPLALERERALLAGLDAGERAALDRLLAKLAATLDTALGERKRT